MDLSALQHKLGKSAGGTGYGAPQVRLLATDQCFLVLLINRTHSSNCGTGDGAPQLLADLILMCKNAVRFNGRGAPTSVLAEELLEFRCAAAAAAACAAAASRMRRAATG